VEEENHKESVSTASVMAGIRTQHLLNKRLKRYRYIKQLVVSEEPAISIHKFLFQYYKTSNLKNSLSKKICQNLTIYRCKSV
jgi:hypothetical protein